MRHRPGFRYGRRGDWLVPYAMNGRLCGIRVSEAAVPSDTVLLVEWPGRRASEIARSSDRIAYRHRERANVVWADGHERSVGHADGPRLWWELGEPPMAQVPPGAP